MSKNHQPKKPAKPATEPPIFSQIAEQLRAVPGRNSRPLEAERDAGILLAEALKRGAFARLKHSHLRSWIDEPIERGRYGAAFVSAVIWLRQHDPGSPAGTNYPPPLHVTGCPLLANALEAEVEVPKSERILAPPVPGRLEAVTLQRDHDDDLRARAERDGWQRGIDDASTARGGRIWGRASLPAERRPALGPGSAADQRATKAQTAATPAAAQKTAAAIDDDAKLPPKEIAELFQVPLEPLKKRLARLRKRDLKSFTEVAGKGPREPKFYYRVGAVRPIVAGLKASRETSRERPARKKIS